MEKYDYQDEDKWCETDLLAFKASTDPDMMYHYQAMRELDRNKFLKAMQDEYTAHYKKLKKLIKNYHAEWSTTTTQCMAHEEKEKAIHRRD